MATVSFDIPDEELCTFDKSPEQFARAVRLAAAMFWYNQNEISIGRAATVAGIPYADFMEALAATKIETFRVDIDELRQELARG
jgi:predicted HTH domain antitoxin